MQSPFKISQLALQPCGEIALSRMPGSVTRIEDDVSAIISLNCACVLTLTPFEELKAAGAERLPLLLERNTIEWHHFPIEDYGTPSSQQKEAWSVLSTRLHQHLEQDRRILVHCYAGVGRSGMVALRLLVERGADPVEALARIRDIRPGAVERSSQYDWAVST